MYKPRNQFYPVDMSIQAVTQRLRIACQVASRPRAQVAMDPMSAAARVRSADVASTSASRPGDRQMDRATRARV